MIIDAKDIDTFDFNKISNYNCIREFKRSSTLGTRQQTELYNILDLKYLTFGKGIFLFEVVISGAGIQIYYGKFAWVLKEKYDNFLSANYIFKADDELLSSIDSLIRYFDDGIVIAGICENDNIYFDEQVFLRKQWVKDKIESKVIGNNDYKWLGKLDSEYLENKTISKLKIENKTRWGLDSCKIRELDVIGTRYSFHIRECTIKNINIEADDNTLKMAIVCCSKINNINIDLRKLSDDDFPFNCTHIKIEYRHEINKINFIISRSQYKKLKFLNSNIINAIIKYIDERLLDIIEIKVED